MIKKSKYEKNTATTNPWSPKAPTISTANNLHSVNYNILSHEENKFTPSMSYTKNLSKSFGRTRGISEINDLSRSTAVNSNVDHVGAIKTNRSVFAKKDGIFTHLYNSAARFGENKPFKA